MKERGPIAKFFFGEVKKLEFSQTPLIDAMTYEQYGTETLPVVTREQALSVPGVMYARNNICSTISTLPLKTYSASWKLVDNPLFRQIDPTRTNVSVLSDTLEDLFFYQYAYWRVLARDAKGFPTYAEYVDIRIVSDPTVPFYKGNVDDEVNNVLRINGEVVSWNNVIRFESPNPGFLKLGGRIVRQALELDKTAAIYAKNPLPLSYFRPMDNQDPGDDAAIRQFLREWTEHQKTGLPSYVPAALEYVPVQQPDPVSLQLVEQQQQVNLSLAVMTGLNPKDFGVNVSTRTYANVQDERQDRINEVYAPYMRSITDRLSMGDVTRRGHTVQFDISDFMKADEKTRAEVQISRQAATLLTPDEIRAAEHLPALTPDQEREVATSGEGTPTTE